MTIQELADRAGVTTRTIRYYVEQGVLPPPERGRPAEYTEEHVSLLDLIRRLKEQYLPLEEIRDMLQRLTPDQVEEFLGGTGPKQAEEQAANSAADYISHVLNRGALRNQLKEQTPPPLPAAIPPPAPSAPAGLPALPVRRKTQTENANAKSATKPLEAPSLDYGHQSAAESDTRGPAEPYMSEERTWQRVTLAPGVELHYEASVATARRGVIHKLIEAARAILGSHPEKGTGEEK